MSVLKASVIGDGGLSLRRGRGKEFLSASHCSSPTPVAGPVGQAGVPTWRPVGLPVLGPLVGNVKSVCILIWALVCSSINGRGWELFLWILTTLSSIPLYFCSELFLFLGALLLLPNLSPVTGAGTRLRC